MEVIYQNLQKVVSNDKLFYIHIAVTGVVKVKAMIDSESMA